MMYQMHLEYMYVQNVVYLLLQIQKIKNFIVIIVKIQMKKIKSIKF